jgi:hypothetical protein
MPRVPYVSLLDICMVVSIFFVFLSIGEFILVSAMIRNGLKVSKMQSISAINIFNAEGIKKNRKHLQADHTNIVWDIQLYLLARGVKNTSNFQFHI